MTKSAVRTLVSVLMVAGRALAQEEVPYINVQTAGDIHTALTESSASHISFALTGPVDRCDSATR
jgi:hypothetical protein